MGVVQDRKNRKQEQEERDGWVLKCICTSRKVNENPPLLGNCLLIYRRYAHVQTRSYYNQLLHRE